jgi:hypothetical protein
MLTVGEEMTEVVPAAEEPDDPKAKRLSPEEWLEIENHCGFNTMSNKNMAIKYGISSQAIYNHFDRLMKDGNPIQRGSRVIKPAAAPVKEPTPSAAPVVSAFNTARKQNIENAKTSLHNQDIAAQRQLMNIQKEIEAKTRAPRECHADIKAIVHLISGLRLLRENRWALLDVENDIDEASLPKLIFEDLSEAEITLMQQSDAGAEGDFDFEEPDQPDDEIVEEGEK